jgi:hypothetical protein
MPLSLRRLAMFAFLHLLRNAGRYFAAGVATVGFGPRRRMERTTTTTLSEIWE